MGALLRVLRCVYSIRNPDGLPDQSPQPLLKSLGKVLESIRSVSSTPIWPHSLFVLPTSISQKLQELVDERDVEVHNDKLKRIEAKYQHKLKRARNETEHARQVLQDTLDTSQRTHAELQAKLQSVRHELEHLQRVHKQDEEELATTRIEKDLLRVSNLKYTKKVHFQVVNFAIPSSNDDHLLQYHALKQAVKETKKRTSPHEDDSLMIVG